MSTTTTASPSLEQTAGPAHEPMCGDAPPPTEQHRWLERFAGVWDSDIEIYLAPGQPSMKSKGVDHVRMLGGFWLLSEGKNLDMPYEARLTLGYDPNRQCYIGTWIDTMSSFLWNYTGTVDATGRVLTLETEGPFPPGPEGRPTKFREVTEFKSDDHRVFTSSRLAENGEWVPCLTIHFRRRT